MRISRASVHVVDPDMTPMIDIVFQLLTFFMLVSNFDQTQADERVKLPRDTMVRPDEESQGDKLVLNIGFLRNEEGDKTDPDPFVFHGGDQFRVANFGARLLQEARIGRQLGREPKSTMVVIRADADVPIGLVQEIIRFSREAEFEQFLLRATQITND